jgi:hypothetical protein
LDSRESFYEAFDTISEQRLASCDANLANAHRNEHSCHALNFIEGKKICGRKPAHRGFVGHAEQACEVAAVGHRNPELGRYPAFRVDEKFGPWDVGFSNQAQQNEPFSL